MILILLTLNSLLTPGAIDPEISRAMVCPHIVTPRAVSTALKKKVCTSYGIKTGCPGQKYEIDHKIPRTCAGDDVAANLWPQPIAQAKLKDKEEVHWHHLVCSGKKTLGECQEHFKRWRGK